jgi:diguanylate cyclase (GGDEF)-like protein
MLSGTFALLGLVVVVRIVVGGERPLDWLTAALVLVALLAAVFHRNAVASLEASRRGEAESFARILTGLSRSISPDAIVDAIVEELADSTGADHVVVVRRRADARVLEATLVSTRPGVRNSTTILPISDLEDPIMPRAARRGRGDIVAIPIEPSLALAGVQRVAVADRPIAQPVGADYLGSPDGPRADPPAEPRTGPPAGSPAGGWRGRGDRAWDNLVGLVAGQPAAADGPGGPAMDGDPAQAAAARIAERVRGVYGLRDVIAAPLATDGEVIGAIVLSRRVADPWPATARRLLNGAAREASMALSRAYSHRAAEARASTDALTGLPNRRYFDEFCGLLARRRRADDAVGVLMIDIDHFKRLNDRFGHATGDEVLRAVGGAIVSAVREDDVPARYGGEEFVVLLRNPTPTVATEVGERVRLAVGGLDVSTFGVARVSVSVGVAVADARDQPIESIVANADAAMYRAKRAGRDRVVTA